MNNRARIVWRNRITLFNNSFRHCPWNFKIFQQSEDNDYSKEQY